MISTPFTCQHPEVGIRSQCLQLTTEMSDGCQKAWYLGCGVTEEVLM